jgi:hypothetical protein
MIPPNNDLGLTAHFRSIIKSMNQDIAPSSEQPWSGWLARYNAAVEHVHGAIPYQEARSMTTIATSLAGPVAAVLSVARDGSLVC